MGGMTMAGLYASHLHTDIIPAPHHYISTRLEVFLKPNQQCPSIEGNSTG